MRGLLKLTIIQAKLFLREPPAVFFTLAFPVFLLLLFGAIFGNGNKPFSGSNFGPVDIMVPSFTAIIVATVAFMGIPISTVTAKERQVLRRFKVARVRPVVYFLSDLLVNFIMALLGMIILIIVAKIVYHLRFGGNVLVVLGAFSLSAFAFYSLGYLIAGLASTTRVAQVVGQIIFFPMMFLSGAAIPLSETPEAIRKIANFIPLTYAVRLLEGAWLGDPLSGLIRAIVILIAILIVGTAISIKVFRWE